MRKSGLYWLRFGDRLMIGEYQSLSNRWNVLAAVPLEICQEPDEIDDQMIETPKDRRTATEMARDAMALCERRFEEGREYERRQANGFLKAS